MSPIEEVRAAIKKLEKLKAESDQPTHGANWVMDKEDEYTTSVFTGPLSQISRDIATYVVTENARLIVTLHATLDAQMAVMRNYTEVYREDKTPYGFAQSILNLARKINGDAA